MGRNEGRKEGEEEKIGQKKKSWRQRQCDRNRFLSPTELSSQGQDPSRWLWEAC